MSKLLNAVVKYPASKVFETQYGERVNAVLTVGDDEIKIWGEPNTPKGEQLKALKRGETVLVIDDNGKYKLLESDSKNTNGNGNGNGNSKPDYAPLSDDKKRAVASYIKDMAGLYSFCRETSIKTLSERFDEQELTPDDVRSMTATLFIATQKHFGI